MKSLFFTTTIAVVVILVALATVTATASASASASATPPPPPHKVYRNVKSDYGAVGDGVHDDSMAFIHALTDGKATTVAPGPWNASQYYCSTTRPTYVFVPPGTYLITQTLPLTYYTQLVGASTADNSSGRPTLQFRFAGGGLYRYCLDAGTDEGPGHGWFGGANQDQFYRLIRNLIIDATQAMPSVAVLHWQVSQGTDLVHLDFLLPPNTDGIYMESGSGGFFNSLRFFGGKTAMKLGNQQWTMRNISIHGAQEGIYLLWGWSWSLYDVYITGAQTGIRLGNGVGAVAIVDSVIEGASYCGICMPSSTQLQLDNVAVSPNPQGGNGNAMQIYYPGSANPQVFHTFPGGTAGSWSNARVFDPATNATKMVMATVVPQHARSTKLAAYRSHGSSRSDVQKLLPLPMYVGAMRPDYAAADVMVAAALETRNGTDVTALLQSLLHKAAAAGKALLLPYGEYLISDTVVVPAGSRVFGQVWTRLVAYGAKFADAEQPRVMLQVGEKSGNGNNNGKPVHLSDLLFTNKGPVPGAILIEWNLGAPSSSFSSASSASSSSSSAAADALNGMWDCHYRIGGAIGTLQPPSLCPTTTTLAASPQCQGAHTLLKLAGPAAPSVMIEAMWMWVSDHNIDSKVGDVQQNNIYNARGLVVAASGGGPLWLYGTASEHSMLFQYNFQRATHVLASVMQTETPYFQGPNTPPLTKLPAPSPLDPPLAKIFPAGAPPPRHALAAVFNTPKFVSWPSASDSELSFIVVHAVGFYSFFDAWSTKCSAGKSTCQRLLLAVYDDGEGTLLSAAAQTNQTLDPTVQFSLINTHGSSSVANFWGADVAAAVSSNGFCDTVSLRL